MSAAAELSFSDFFEAVHGRWPFPWQERAAAHLARREVYSVDVPTGMGKSALVDAAVWAASKGAWRRIAFVVDRRIVVDAVHQRAERIAATLASAPTPELRQLSELIGEMQVVRLRGGVHGDDDWVLYPERLSVVLTTVDQLGSRLLFRGYGTSPRRWPMHAAFFSSDTLIVIDEAHLSVPLLQTLQVLQRHDADIALLPMSATLPQAPRARVVALDTDDLAVDTVRQRLCASKPAGLVESGEGADFIKTVVAQASAMAEQPGVTRLGVVVNRVDSARRCFERLRSEGFDATLLTGRVRPADRDRMLHGVLSAFEAGRGRVDHGSLKVLVATQTIEVGADLDFDALVTESAPLSALRQRFGRLDRLGERGRSPAVIVHRRSSRSDDPVYGAAVGKAWAWLQVCGAADGGKVDFGLDAFDALQRRNALPEEATVFAATLLPSHLQLLAQTGPFSPEIALGGWLHGASDRAADVSVVWRDDLIAEQCDDWPLAAVMVPPMLREALPIGIAALRRFLAGNGAAMDAVTSDLESAPADEREAADAARPVLRWRGPDDCKVITAGEIRPGDTVLLPAAYGGCDDWGWTPASTEPVDDLADLCMAEALESGARRRPALRLAEGHWRAFGDAADTLRDRVAALLALEEQAATEATDLEDELAAARTALVDAVRQCGHPLASLLREPAIEHHPGGFVLRGHGMEEVEGVIEVGHAVPLDVHHADVARWARHLADDSPHAAQIVAAAEVHDAGKREPRMQVLLHGNPLRAAKGPALAKSALRCREQQLAAYQAARLPRGFRHEFASLTFEALTDPLTRHLVATHHGYGRPWLVPCEDTDAAGARHAHLDQHWASDWATMVAQHGLWVVTRAEWLLRCADARASIEEASREVLHEARDGQP